MSTLATRKQQFYEDLDVNKVRKGLIDIKIKINRYDQNHPYRQYPETSLLLMKAILRLSWPDGSREDLVKSILNAADCVGIAIVWKIKRVKISREHGVYGLIELKELLEQVLGDIMMLINVDMKGVFLEVWDEGDALIHWDTELMADM
ncbi:hypothetical protein HDV00_009681 [Rhizophlyctis rosea]|nr:hypothetical protein HDV00_009681 [Rhizophlyctis rosea]